MPRVSWLSDAKLNLLSDQRGRVVLLIRACIRGHAPFVCETAHDLQEMEDVCESVTGSDVMGANSFVEEARASPI
jgi:hypothetical protein